MAAHQQFGQFTIALRQRVNDLSMLQQGRASTLLHPAAAAPAHAQQGVLFAAQHGHQAQVATTTRDLVMKIEIALALRIRFAALTPDLCFVMVEQSAKLCDLIIGHLHGGDATGHALQCLAHDIKIGQRLSIQDHDSRAGVGDARDQTHSFQLTQGFAQRPTPNSKSLCQLRLVKFLALVQLASDDAMSQPLCRHIGESAFRFWNFGSHQDPHIVGNIEPFPG